MQPSDLPAHLAARTRVPDAQPDARPDGQVILYWQRMALRTRDNPALDVARSLATQTGLPLLVYQGLSSRYPWASDRHHRFILEGARDLQAAYAATGEAYALHLERPGDSAAHLLTLARQARVVVTEDVPVAFLRRWTARVASASATPLWLVDAACLAPMARVPAAATDRAFRFRKAAADLQALWLDTAWPETDPVPADGAPLELPFDPFDAHGADLAASIAGLPIDHAVAPVPDSPGGSNAGEARWAAFRDGALADYHRDRNDPLRPAVSRMSAYLHYGMVSPFQLAREANASGGDGANKFLDELLVWRELSWAWARRQPDPESLDVLPGWARDSLQAHARDPRPALPGWEALARGRTGDRLWDTAQLSLLRHGELHNNVRMTWGKALLEWTADPRAALRMLLDLNNRYALDGRDPNSYGGLYWCLGLFDRPFPPARPVTGVLRPRPSAQHAQRLDVERWRHQLTRPRWRSPRSVLVVGAGLAGLLAARTLADHGLTVTVLDKGRRPGGRAARREHSWLATPVHHGVDALQLDDPRLQPLATSWREAGIDSAPGLARHLADELAVHCATQVEQLQHADGRWTADAGATSHSADALLLALPAPQAAALLPGTLPWRDALAGLDTRPVWALIWQQAKAIAIPERLPAPLRALRHTADGSWVAHADAAWTSEHLELSAEDAAAALADAVRAALPGLDPQPQARRAHRWRHAEAQTLYPGACLTLPEQHLVAVGDWCAGEAPGTPSSAAPDRQGVQRALLAGLAGAGRLLGLRSG